MRGIVTLCALAAAAFPATRQDHYPTPPRALPDAEEIALAVTAAPPAISARAEVWAVRPTGAVKIRSGTNGIACAVVRDLHDESVYPICFDREATKSAMPMELLKTTLRAQGKTETQVDRELAAAYASGRLRHPTKPAISYMMSPRQVLFSSPYASGQRVGAWYPHLMISMPGMTTKQLGIDSTSQLDVLQLDSPGKPDAQLVVKVRKWSDGTAVKEK